MCVSSLRIADGSLATMHSLWDASSSASVMVAHVHFEMRCVLYAAAQNVVGEHSIDDVNPNVDVL